MHSAAPQTQTPPERTAGSSPERTPGGGPDHASGRPQGRPKPRHHNNPRMRKLAREGWISDQHGAWTMMAFPPLLGWALSYTFSWMVVLMLVAWAMAFQMFSAVCLWVKTPAKRRARIAPAVITYAVLAALPGATLLAVRPQLLWWAIAFAPLASSALYLVWKGRERSLGARTASILAGNIMGPVAFSLAVADGSPAAVTIHAWATCAAFGLHYIGTVPLVRSMIRGRKDPRWAVGSTLLHAAFTLCAAAAWWFGALTIWPVLMWALLTARAWAMPTISRKRARPLSPKLIGFSELGWSLLLIVSLLIP